jgi:hypothetical protein
MSTARQVAELYLRGSVVNITMKNLTEDQQRLVGEKIEEVTSLQGIAQTRQLISKKLAETIGGEYREDKDAAMQETMITIWRGIVDLYYHRRYTFICDCCGTTSYTTKTGKKREIDQVFDYCKECNCVKVTSVGESKPVTKDDKIIVLVEDEFVDREVFQESYAHLKDGDDLPTCKSPIKYIAGDKKYSNPAKVFETNDDTTKFFREFLWGNFKQIIKENERKQINKKPKKEIGRADVIVVKQILSMLSKYRVSHNFCANTQPEQGWFNIQASLLQAPPEVSIELAPYLEDAFRFDVPVELTERNIRIGETLAAPDIERFISNPEYVLMQDNHTTTGDDEQGSYTLTSISARTVDGVRMDLEDHIGMAESSDWLATVRNQLPSGLTQRVFDLFQQRGDDYPEFSEQFGDKEPKISHMAQFFNVGRKAICEAKTHIRVISCRFMSKDERVNISLSDLQERDEAEAMRGQKVLV